MLNCYYWFAGLWIFILVIYSLNWSSFNVLLDPQLLLFLLTASVIAFLIGFIFSGRYRYVTLQKAPSRKPFITYGLVLGFCIEMLHNRSIPLVSIGVSQLSSYGDFQGLPGIHVILISLGIFYSSYLYYLYLETRRRSLLIEVSVIQVFFLLVFSRSSIVFSVLLCAILHFSKQLEGKKKLLQIKVQSIIILIMLIVFVPFLFGLFGNIRSGVPILDDRYISSVASISSDYPKYLSKQYLWTYSYLTSPLANLNLNIIQNNTSLDLLMLPLIMIPETLVKFIYTGIQIDAVLWNEALNACTGFIEPFYFGGIAGMWIYMGLTFLYLFVLQSIRRDNPFHTLVCATSCLLIICQFFLNSLSFMGLAPIPFYAIVCLIWNDNKMHHSVRMGSNEF